MYFPPPPKRESAPPEPAKPDTEKSADQQPPQSHGLAHAEPISGWVVAFLCFGCGAATLVFNVCFLAFHGEYYPIIFLLGFPALFAGTMGFIFPTAIGNIVNAANDRPLLRTGGEFDGTWLVNLAVFIGFILGGYLMYDPTALLRFIPAQ